LGEDLQNKTKGHSILQPVRYTVDERDGNLFTIKSIIRHGIITKQRQAKYDIFLYIIVEQNLFVGSIYVFMR